jgi:hypothetical protein
MGCDYYRYKEIIVNYTTSYDTIEEYILETNIIEEYYGTPKDYDSYDDEDTLHNKFNEYVEELLRDINNKPEKILFTDGKWNEARYETRYSLLLEDYLENIPEKTKIKKINMIYKRESAIERL